MVYDPYADCGDTCASFNEADPYGAINLLDIALFSYDSVSVSFGAVNANTRAVFFRSNGLAIYTDDNVDRRVYYHTLSTAWDLSTITTHVSNVSISAEISSSVGGLFFSTDGTKMYAADYSSHVIYQYTLSSAWDITSASYASKSLSISAQDWYANFKINPDGTKLFLAADATGHLILEYTLSTPWDISTGSLTTSFDSSAVAGFENDIIVPLNGLQLYIISNSSIIYQYTMSTAWDLSTATYDSKSTDISAQAANGASLFFSTDNSKLYVYCWTNNLLYQYSTGGLVACSTFDSSDPYEVSEL